MITHKYLVTLSLALISAGLIISAPVGVLRLAAHPAVPLPAAAKAAAPSQSQQGVRDTVQGIPRRIRIADLGIDVAVKDGYYDSKTGQWTISEEAAYFATPTTIANSEAGNTFIYGHNSRKIFGKLLSVKPGMKAVVETDSGAQFTYTFISTEAVRPQDASILEYSGKPRLTLQTCSGVWNQHRQIFYFDLTNFKK